MQARTKTSRHARRFGGTTTPTLAHVRSTTNRERTINMEVRAAMATSEYTKML
jgi:hypothetical protein